MLLRMLTNHKKPDLNIVKYDKPPLDFSMHSFALGLKLKKEFKKEFSIVKI